MTIQQFVRTGKLQPERRGAFLKIAQRVGTAASKLPRNEWESLVQLYLGQTARGQ